MNELQNEIWKPIEGYEGLYEVSNYGRVKSLKHNKIRILKPTICTKGYYFLRLWKNKKGKTYRVNRLVAIAFVPNPNNLPLVNHIDENKLNNCSWNLEWCDNKYNCNYGTRNKRMSISLVGKNINHKTLSKPVRCIETNIVYPSANEAARQNKCYGSGITACCRGINKTAGGYRWEYV